MSPRTSPRAALDDDCEWLTLDEAAQRLGISRESVRRMARRKRWAKLSGNDGLVRIGVPVDRLSRVPGQALGPDLGPAPGPTPGRDLGQDQEGSVATEAESESPELVLRVLERLSAAQGELVKMGKRLGAAEAEVSSLKQERDALKQDRDRWAGMAEASQRQLVDLTRKPRGLARWFGLRA